MTNTNPDYVYNWAIEQPVVEGFDLSRGTDGHGNQSPIEDSVLENGVLRYTNPRIRFQFYTPAEFLKQVARLKEDLGAIVGDTRTNDTFKMAEGEKRRAHDIEVDGVWYPLNQFRALSSTGTDANGVQIYDGNEYDLGVDGPGTYHAEPAPKSDAGGPPMLFSFTPDKK
jgi:hypothetical protein